MQLLETIRFEKGVFSNLNFHQIRMDKSRRELFNCIDSINLMEILNKLSLPKSIQVFKLRIVYDKLVREIDFVPYKRPNKKSLKLIFCDKIDYSYKYLDRKLINDRFIKKGEADDIIIVKNGLITDSSFANLLFYDGEKWFTPAKPLLKGTQRDKMIAEERAIEVDITPADLALFKNVRLINAMIRFEDEVDISISNVIT